MNLFINDIPARILKWGELPDVNIINSQINAREEGITKAQLINHLYIKDASVSDMVTIFELLNSKVPISLLSLHISIDDYQGFLSYMKKKFKVVKAAGGLVKKKDRFLMIYRMKRWDLPKGKREAGENSRKTAIREVEEECNVKALLGEKICTTWHTYTMNSKNMVKKTKWFTMDLVDDSRMRPEAEEDIEELRWMTEKEVYHALENSYRSIRFVFEQYYKQKTS